MTSPTEAASQLATSEDLGARLFLVAFFDRFSARNVRVVSFAHASDRYFRSAVVVVAFFRDVMQK